MKEHIQQIEVNYSTVSHIGYKRIQIRDHEKGWVRKKDLLTCPGLPSREYGWKITLVVNDFV